VKQRIKIGVFDSGVGGLTVLKELIHYVPRSDYIYFGDTARLPYGSKSADTVARYATEAATFLEKRGIEMLVVACNTATALALDAVADSVKVPVIGVIQPGAEAVSRLSKSRKAVVVGTEATIASHAYQRALAKCGIESYEKACPLFVPLVEEGWTEHNVTEQVARIYLGEAFENGSEASDTLLLGCTHYPLLKPMLRRILRPDVAIVDSAESTAETVAREFGFEQEGEPAETKLLKGSLKLQFYVTDSVDKFRRLGTRFLGYSVDCVQHAVLGV
jgi:glutamate racemase